MDFSEDKELVKNFIFNENVQQSIDNINNNTLDFNILDITGMSTQEIKHSNILAWLFEDKEHNLESRALEDFLKKVMHCNEIEELQSYIYLSKNKKDIVVYREKDNIDLLIIDKANSVMFVIENKVFANERVNGSDGGQLKKYEDIINEKYSDSKYEKYFIYLTRNLSEPSRKNWLKADYQMIIDVLNEILKNKEISLKTKIIFDSYMDTLKRNGIVEDKELKELCLEIWENQKYRKALDILNNYKPDVYSLISEYLQKVLLESYQNQIELDDSTKTYIRFVDKRWDCQEQNKGEGWTSSKKVLIYEFQNSSNGLHLKLIIGPSQNDVFRNKLFNIAQSSNQVSFIPGNTLSTKWNQIWKKQIIAKQDIEEKSFEELKTIINDKLDKFFTESSDFNKIFNIFEEVMSV